MYTDAEANKSYHTTQKSIIPYHRKSQSLDAATITAQLSNNGNLSTPISNNTGMITKGKTYSYKEK